MSKDTFYFSHDYNSRNDSKIKKLLQKHGYLGYGIFWAIIEDLYNNANALPKDYASIAFDLRTTENFIKSIINDFDLFVTEDNSFGSLSVQKRLEERNKKSLKARESAFKRWNKDANALQTQSDSNAIKESKGKENKGDEIIKKFNFKNSLIEYGFNENLVNDWMLVRKNKKSTNSETAYKLFIEEIEKRNCDLNKTLELIVSKSWAGFKWEWVDKEKPTTDTSRLQVFFDINQQLKDEYDAAHGHGKE